MSVSDDDDDSWIVCLKDVPHSSLEALPEIHHTNIPSPIDQTVITLEYTQHTLKRSGTQTTQP